MKWDKALRHVEIENRNLEQQSASMREVLEEILPLAMGASCYYDRSPGATPQHCCDWNGVVKHICDVLGKEYPQTDFEEDR